MGNLYQEIQSLLDKYFNEKAINFIEAELKKIDLTREGVFFQVSQKEETPEFEIVYLSGKVIVYYKFRGIAKDLILLPLRSISNVQFKEARIATRLIISSGDLSLTFRATLRSRTQIYLKDFFNGIQKILEDGD